MSSKNTSEDRPDRKTKELRGGFTVHEADDCQFVSSPSRTVHKRGEATDGEYDYEYHPKCGTRLPSDSLWSEITAESEAEAVLKYALKPCSRCFENCYELERQLKKRHSAIVMNHVETKTYPFEEETDD